MGRLEDQVAVVTGAARGQGRAIAALLAREGADVVAVDIGAPLPGVPYEPATPADLDETARLVEAAGRRAVAEVVDVRDLAALREVVDAAVADLGRLDVVVANAGICIPHAWDAISPEEFALTIDVNVTGVWNTVMATAPHVIAGGRGGAVVLTSSYAGLKLQPFMVHYTASKHAVTGMARAFAAELGRHGIRVNSLHPGGVETPMGGPDVRAALESAAETHPTLMQMGTPFLPRWMATPEEIADAVRFLVCEESRFITAAALPVDGGMAQF